MYQKKLINLKYIKMFGEAIQGHIEPQWIDWKKKVKSFAIQVGIIHPWFSKGFYIDMFPVYGYYKEAPDTEEAFDYFLRRRTTDTVNTKMCL